MDDHDWNAAINASIDGIEDQLRDIGRECCADTLRAVIEKFKSHEITYEEEEVMNDGEFIKQMDELVDRVCSISKQSKRVIKSYEEMFSKVAECCKYRDVYNKPDSICLYYGRAGESSCVEKRCPLLTESEEGEKTV